MMTDNKVKLPTVVNLNKKVVKSKPILTSVSDVLKPVLEYGTLNEVTLDENLPYDRLHIVLAYPEHFQFRKSDNKYWQLDYIIPRYLFRKNRSPEGVVKVTYREKSMGIGRHQTFDLNDSPLCSSAGFPRYARNFMYHDTGLDIDMENCSGRIFKYLLTLTKLPHKAVDEYVEDRDKKLKELQNSYGIDRDKAKNLSIRLSYGGTVEAWMKEVGTTEHPGQFWEDLQSEIAGLVNKLRLLDIWRDCPISEEKSEAAKDSEEPEVDPEETEMQVFLRDLDAEERAQKARFSYIVQHLEKRILMVALETCKSESVKPMALCYDGLIVSKSSLQEERIEPFLELLQQRVSEKFPGLDMKFKVKKMECPPMLKEFNKKEFEREKHRFNPVFMAKLKFSSEGSQEIKDELKEQEEIYNRFGTGVAKAKAKLEMKRLKSELEDEAEKAKTKDYIRQMAYFESFVGLVQRPQLLYYLKDFDKSEDWGFYSKAGFVDLLSSEKDFVKRWLADPTRLTFTRVDFMPRPLECPSNILNTFHGLAIEDTPSPAPGQVDFTPILDHIKLLCNGDEEVADYLLKYFAHMVQKPGEIPKVAIVLQSLTQGVGKNILIENMCKVLMGIDYLHTTSKLNTVTGQFSGSANKFVVVLDEVEYKNHKEVDGIMKNYIVSETVSWEAKGKQIVTINNFSRFFILSNKQKPIKLDPSDRRYFIIECLLTEDELPDTEYYDELGALLTDKATMRGFFDYLMSINLSSFKVTQFPVTEARKEMLDDSRHNIFNFLEEFTESHCNNPDGSSI